MELEYILRDVHAETKKEHRARFNMPDGFEFT